MARVRTTLPSLQNGPNLQHMVGAVIYVRVSDPRQAENLSLATQLKACEEYCDRQGFEVLERFREQGESAKTADRTELQALLQYCRTHKGKVHFVVVFNLTRFAREKYDHFALRAHLKSLGISLRSATEPIDDTATGKLMEGVLAAFEQFATGRYTKQQVLEEVTRLGLRSRRGLKVSSQTFDAVLENQLYIGVIDVREYGMQSKRGDFEPLIDEKLFYRVQGILNRRVRVIAPPQRSRPDFPLLAFVRCQACGRALTGSWSKGRNGRFAYYHCRGGECRDANIAKAKLESLFVDELARLQPSSGYMRLVKERVVQVWDRAKSDVKEKAEAVERRIKAIRQRIDRLDNAFLYEQSIDIDTYDRHKERLNEELTLARMDRHATEL